MEVSVIIPAYNGAAFIRDALESIFAQSSPPAEIIVVDDRSTDDTPRIVDSCSAHSPVPIRHLRLDSNSGGPAVPINVGLQAARGELISIVDQDDVVAPRKLEFQSSVLASEPTITVVGSWCGSWNDVELTRQSEKTKQDVLSSGRQEDGFVRIAGQSAAKLLMRYGQFLVGYPGFMFRREQWLQKGGLDEKLRIASDYDLLCWLATAGDFALIPEIGYRRREHDGNVCRNRPRLYYETSKVEASFFRNCGFLRTDRSLRDHVASRNYTLGYWLRNQGRYPEARRLFTSNVSLRPLHLTGYSALLKLHVHWALSRLKILRCSARLGDPNMPSHERSS